MDHNFEDILEVIAISAEMSSLFKVPGFKLGDRDRVHLVATDTPEGHFCANAIKYLIKEKWAKVGENKWDDAIVKIHADIDGLGRADDADFASVGLPNLLEFLQKTIAKLKTDNYDVFLVPTGGYKALIPYMVIAGILERVPNRYVYEESDTVLELPPLPLHVDVPAWIEIQTVMNVLEGKEDYLKNRVFEEFQKQFRGLLIPDKGTGKLKRTGLDKILNAKASTVAQEPELILRTKNSPLLKFLDDGTLKDMFLKLAGIGHLIWKGDKIPEMVDHGLRHHNDLFLLAERILLPIIYHKPDFLKPHELYTLLAALFLHDCGHVVGTVSLDDKEIRLLPIEVRDHHHVLGYLRLMDYNGGRPLSAAIYDSLRSGSQTNEQIWKGFLQAPATIGLYHRKKMLLSSDDSKWRYVFFGQNAFWLSTMDAHLKENPISVNAIMLDNPRAKLLVALLRIIDGLDEQASRTGSPSDVAFHLAQLETERQEEERIGDGLRQAIGKIDGLSDVLEKVDKIIDGRMLMYLKSELKGHKDEGLSERESKQEIKSLCHPCFVKEREEILGNNPYRQLLEEYIHLRFRSYLKRFQAVPYGEKVYIKGVKIEDRSCNKCIKLGVSLDVLDPGKNKGGIDEYIRAGCPKSVKKDDQEMYIQTPDGAKKYKKFMTDAVKKEYETVREILNNEDIFLEYVIS